jgi:hypothetical protein
MGLKEDMKEMYRRLGVMEERVRQLPSLNIPKEGDVDKDLGKAKDQKDFDKKKKDWQTKLDKAEAAVKDTDAAIESFADGVKKVKSANYAQYSETTQAAFDNRIAQVQDAIKALKSTGQAKATPPLEKILERLQQQREDYLERRRQTVKEVNQEIEAMWKLMSDANSKWFSIKQDVAGEKEALKNAKFGGGAKAKVKAGKR